MQCKLLYYEVLSQKRLRIHLGERNSLEEATMLKFYRLPAKMVIGLRNILQVVEVRLLEVSY